MPKPRTMPISLFLLSGCVSSTPVQYISEVRVVAHWPHESRSEAFRHETCATRVGRYRVGDESSMARVMESLKQNYSMAVAFRDVSIDFQERPLQECAVARGTVVLAIEPVKPEDGGKRYVKTIAGEGCEMSPGTMLRVLHDDGGQETLTVRSTDGEPFRVAARCVAPM